MCVLSIPGRFAPSRLLKNQVSLAAQLRLCLVGMLNVTLLPFVHTEHD